MDDNLTWKMAADYLEEKGFDEQAAALRVFAGFSTIAVGRTHFGHRFQLDMNEDKVFRGDMGEVVQFLRDAANRIEDRIQAEYDIIQRDEARMRQIPNGGV